MPTNLPIDTREQARHALDAAADGERRVLDAFTYGRAAPFFVLWGAVWAVGFIGTGLQPEASVVIWTVSVAVGWLGTALLARVRTARDGQGQSMASRYALSAALLSAHAVLWASVLLSHQPNALGVYAGSVTGCGYAIAGLWRGPLLVVLGLAITGLFTAGLLMPSPSFAIYAGVTGGGGLIAAGFLLGGRDPT